MPVYVVSGPNGQKYRVTAPEGATDSEVMARVRRAAAPKEKPTSFWQGLAEGVSSVANNALDYAEQMPIVGVPAKIGATIADLIDGGSSKNIGSLSGRAREASQKVSDRSRYRGSTIGKIAGQTIATLPVAAAPGGILLQGGLGGALATDDPRNPTSVTRDFAIGAGAAKVGDEIGKRVVAPVAERIGRTKAVRTIGDMARSAASKVAPNLVPPAAPVLSTADRAVNRMAPELDAVRQNLQDAADLGLPYSLADASPELRTLAGSVARKSPRARTIAEQALQPRAIGQADRAVNAIDRLLAPITDIEARAGDIRRAAQTASQPFYTEAAAKAAPVDESVAAMLQTPAGKSALKSAFDIALNEGKDPRGLGFDLNDLGEVVVTKAPSFETLQLVKRGLDAQLNQFRNPITGNLNLEGNAPAQAIANLGQRFNSRLGEINEPYRLGNEAYADVIRLRDALNLGQRVAGGNVPQRQFDAAMARMDDATLPELQRGYATSMADVVNRRRLSGNPYDAVFGSPDQQAKVAALFPEGSPQFNRQYQLEGDMAATRNEAIGGSPTAMRIQADQLFDAALASDPAQEAIRFASNPKMGLFNMARQKVQDQLRTRGEQRATEIAPVLFNTSPEEALSYLTRLLQSNADLETRKAAYRELGSLLGLPVAGAAVGTAGAVAP